MKLARKMLIYVVYRGVASGCTGVDNAQGLRGSSGPPTKMNPKYNHWFWGPSLFLVHGLPGARCSSWCDGSSDRSFMLDPLSFFSRSSLCSMIGVTKAVVCVTLSVG